MFAGLRQARRGPRGLTLTSRPLNRGTTAPWPTLHLNDRWKKARGATAFPGRPLADVRITPESGRKAEIGGRLKGARNRHPADWTAWLGCEGMVSKRRGSGYQSGRVAGTALDDRRRSIYFGSIRVTPEGPLPPTTWITTSPSFAQTKCGCFAGSVQILPVGSAFMAFSSNRSP